MKAGRGGGGGASVLPAFDRVLRFGDSLVEEGVESRAEVELLLPVDFGGRGDDATSSRPVALLDLGFRSFTKRVREGASVNVKYE